MEVRKTTTSFTGRRTLQSDGANKYPAPLQAEISRRFSVMKSQPTPPDTPVKAQAARFSTSIDQPVFHNYLRAFCKYDPPTDIDGKDEALLLTVRIRPGDLILVHSVHANGWADGTVLTTNTRGWLPTNYCETFDHPYMRNLLTAMTQFWDLLGANQEANLSTFVRQDYIRPLIAGVRYLLEHADCLHRDARLVQQNTGLHRLRKGLLADLSGLVQIAKSLQETVRTPSSDKEVLALLDQSVTRACKVVTRAVGFVDMLARETGDAPQVKRASLMQNRASRFAAGSDGLTPRVETVKRISTQPALNGGGLHIAQLDGRSPKMRPRSGLTSHRLSTIKPEPRSTSGTLASEQLARAHDLCISHIAGFIGLYLHPSVPAADLIASTQSLKEACDAMLGVVRRIAVYEPHGQASIQQAQKNFETTFDKLTGSTGELFADVDTLDQDIVMLPERTDHLVQLGTGLIKRVGECVVKIRKVIEQIGDFDLDRPRMMAEGAEQASSGAALVSPLVSPLVEEFHDAQSRTTSDTDNAPTIRPSSPYTEGGTGPPEPAVSGNTVSSPSRLSRPFLLDAPFMEAPPPIPINSRNQSQSSPSLLVSPVRKMSVGNSISASTDTQKSSMRDSVSAVSEISTRATTPDQGLPKGLGILNSFESGLSVRATAMNNVANVEEAEAQLLQKTYANELTLNKDGQVTGGSLPALVEHLTTSDTPPDAQFVAAFFITFRSFTTAQHLAHAFIERFDYVGDSTNVGVPSRMRVADALKVWLETYWNMELDKDALGEIRYFALHKLKPVMEAPADRLLDVIRKLNILYQNGGTNRHLMAVNKKLAFSGAEEKAPEPAISKSQLNTLRKIAAAENVDCSVLDLDSLELARQLTVLASRIFCSIQPEELLSLEWNKKESRKAVNVRHMCTLNTDLAHFVGDTILNPEDAKKRALVIKHWSKVASRCLELDNYESLMAIMCSLNSSVVQRLKRTWEVVNKKTKYRIEELNSIIDFSRNQTALRQKLNNVTVPCLPFLGIYLTDLTMIDAGNPKYRELTPGTTTESGDTNVINFDKHLRLAKIISHIQSFQHPYNLKPVPELQTWIEMHLGRMRGRQAQMVGDFHRRSLYIEPKRDPNASIPPVPVPAIPNIPEYRRDTDPADRGAVDSTMVTSGSVASAPAANTNTTSNFFRPKTPADGTAQTTKTFKPRGQTFEFFMKANFSFKSGQGDKEKEKGEEKEKDKPLPPLPPPSVYQI